MSDSTKFIKMCNYFELILRITKLGKDESYQLNDYENELLNDKSLYNNFMLSVLTRVSMNGIEEENHIYKDDMLKNKILDLISNNMEYGDLDDTNIIFQIRNCFSHSNAWCDEENLYLKNSKISGYINAEKAFFDLLILFSPHEQTGKYQKKYSKYLLYLPHSLDNESKLNDLLDNTKELDIKFNDNNKYQIYNDKIMRLSSISTLIGCSCNRLTNVLTDMLSINKKDIRVRPINDNERGLIKDYITYVGEEDFYKLSFHEQKDCLGHVLFSSMKENTYSYLPIYTLMSEIIKKKEPNQKTIDFNEINSDKPEVNDLMLKYCTYLYRPFMYEKILMVYQTYIFNVLKEHKMNNNFLEGYIDYEKLDISRFEYKYKDNKKKNLLEEKNKLLKYYEECNRLITKYNNDIERLLETRIKIDNPKNKKREEHLEKNMNEILKIKGLIEKTNQEIENILYKLDYINDNNEIYKDNNQFFRGMRNSNTHYGFDIFRNKAYQIKDLDELSFYYYDYMNNKKVFECYFNNNDFIDLVNQMKDQIINKNKELIKS